jgi:hypothetical protein
VLREVGSVGHGELGFVADDEHVLRVHLLAGLREVHRARDDRRAVDDHNLVVRDRVDNLAAHKVDWILARPQSDRADVVEAEATAPQRRRANGHGAGGLAYKIAMIVSNGVARVVLGRGLSLAANAAISRAGCSDRRSA